MLLAHAKRKLLGSLFFTLMVSGAFSEPFRISQCHTVQLEERSDFSVSEKLGLNDGIAIYLPEQTEDCPSFINGIEIKMDIPEGIVIWRDCCGCYVYQDIKPQPTPEQIDYNGNKVYFNVLPGKLSWVLQIPLAKEHHFKTNQYTTTIDKIPDVSNGFVFIRLQPIMKGVPDEVLDSLVNFTIRPVLMDKGLLKLDLSAPETEKNQYESENILERLTVFIDDNPYKTEAIEDGFVLDSGIHNISIISENYRTEVRTVRIDQAKITKLDVTMKSIEPTMIITAPEGSTVFFDDDLCKDFGNEFIISEGEHTVRCNIGDYSIVKAITAIKGKTYKANLSVDLQFSEE